MVHLVFNCLNLVRVIACRMLASVNGWHLVCLQMPSNRTRRCKCYRIDAAAQRFILVDWEVLSCSLQSL